MATVIIPKKLTQGEELVVIPRKEYEEFSYWKETASQFKEFTPTLAQKKDLRRAHADYQKGKYLTVYELKRRLAAQSKRKSI